MGVHVGENNPADIPAVGKYGFTKERFEHSDNRGLKRKRVKIAYTQEVLVEGLPPRDAAFAHADTGIRDAFHQVRFIREPAVFPAHFKHLSSHLKYALRVEQAAEEQAPVLFCPLPEFTRIRQEIWSRPPGSGSASCQPSP